MGVSYKEINELLASKKTSDDIQKANRYLTKGTGSKPEWLEDFLESNESKLKETILRAISSSEGMSSLSGYKEGYFNEIIQNANDLHVGDTIDIELNTDSTVYSVKCTYQDKGFNLSNIYALLNREMSDKSSEEGQTGKFGVGIKSFFKFVSKFRIESNVIFDFTIDRDASRITDSIVSINNNWNKENTVLYFEFNHNEQDETCFNTRKLCDLIDFFNGNKECDISEFFLSGEDENIVFDIHSLVFMNRNQNKKTISRLNFSGCRHKMSVACENIYAPQKLNDDKWEITNVRLSVTLDDNNYKCDEYIVFTHSDISLCFPLTIELGGYNRIYSTYYIKRDDKPNLLPIGMLINTKSVNIHRTDLGDNESSIEKAYEKIRTVFKDMLWFMCSSEIKAVICLDDVSDIFHSILLVYLNEDNEKYEESPFNQKGLDNQYLPKISNNFKTDIVIHQNIENYQKATVLDQHLVPELEKTYFNYIEKENVIDYNELIDSEECIWGVSHLYPKLRYLDQDDDNYSEIVRMLHFYPSVAVYMSYVITNDYRNKPYLSDSEIDEWLFKMKNTLKDNYNQELFLKLIGRYGLNDSIAFDGTLRKENLSFKDYLFNGLTKDGTLSNWQNEQYDYQYADMKSQVAGNRLYDPGNKRSIYKIRFIAPYSYSRRKWNGIYDCYSLPYRNECLVSEKNKLILLEKIASDFNLRKSIDNAGRYLFEKRPINWEYRENRYSNGKPFEYCCTDYEQQIIKLEFLKTIKLSDYNDFLHAVEYRKIIKEDLSSFNISIKCEQTAVTTHEIINNYLPYLVEPDEGNSKTSNIITDYNEKDVIIHSIVENTNNELPEENIRFILLVSGYSIHLSSFDSQSRKSMIVYFGNRTAAIKITAKNSFKPIATYDSSDKKVYIFYDNASDINEVVALVLKLRS